AEAATVVFVFHNYLVFYQKRIGSANRKKQKNPTTKQNPHEHPNKKKIQKPKMKNWKHTKQKILNKEQTTAIEVDTTIRIKHS
ncbi:hypothetical protein ACPTHF_13080, partial [Enterococcus faecalis]|uniref:hypothetical protein n=1 Tax=Enterococcus faecalis TaxID=1351 RepID=UPI003CC63375